MRLSKPIRVDCDDCVYRDCLPDYDPCSICLDEFDVSGRFPRFCDANEHLEALHAADVVEVVRCKDCVYWKYAEGTAFCESWDRFVENPDYYCASGRQRDG